MAQQSEIIYSIEKFREDYPDPNRVAFLMMKFENSKPHQKIVEVLKDIFQKNGISLVRADDKEYHSDLFLNIETYLHCCGIGVALFDSISNNDFNPNVSLEVGYMIALHKPVLHLKDKRLTTLPTDLTGKLYKSFDTYDPETSLPDNINKWLRDNKLCFSCFECYITLEKPRTELVNNMFLLESVVNALSNYSILKKPIVKNVDQTNDGNTILVFEGPIEFYQLLKNLFETNKPFSILGTKILDVATFERKYANTDTFSQHGRLSAQLCRLSGIQGSEHLEQEALNYLPPNNTTNIKQGQIYITMNGVLTYFHSNVVNFAQMYPTKLLTNSKDFSLIEATMLICGCDLMIRPTEEDIIFSHYKHIRYLIKSEIRKNLKFDLAGAMNVKYV